MTVTCPCGTAFEARSSKARYCSDRCRKRKGKSDALVVDLPRQTEGDTGAGTVESATLAALTEAGRADHPLGAAALALARRVDSPGLDTGSALAAVVRQLEATLAAATKGAAAATAPGMLQDELAARRAAQGA